VLAVLASLCASRHAVCAALSLCADLAQMTFLADLVTIPGDLVTIPDDLVTIPDDLVTIPDDLVTIPDDLGVCVGDDQTLGIAI
jgi:hypothetical protein